MGIVCFGVCGCVWVCARKCDSVWCPPLTQSPFCPGDGFLSLECGFHFSLLDLWPAGPSDSPASVLCYKCACDQSAAWVLGTAHKCSELLARASLRWQHRKETTCPDDSSRTVWFHKLTQSATTSMVANSWRLQQVPMLAGAHLPQASILRVHINNLLLPVNITVNPTRSSNLMPICFSLPTVCSEFTGIPCITCERINCP